jgi:hypothetical protein
MVVISSCIVCLSAFKSIGRLLYTLLFKYPHRKKAGAVRSVNEEVIPHHQNEISPAAETSGKAQPC